MKKTLLTVALMAAATVQAEQHLSIGTSIYKAKEESFNGLNIVYSDINRAGTGLIIQPQWVTDDSDGRKQKIMNTSVGMLMGTESSDILRVYPLVGVAYYRYSDKNESYSKLWPSAGAGIQLQIPKTNFFIDASYKRIFTIGRDKDINAFSVGGGYTW